MQVTKRQEANYREREMKHRLTQRSGQRIGTCVRRAWLGEREQGGMEMAGVWVCSAEGRKTEQKKPIQSSPVSLIQLQSLPGLVEQDVSRLRVLGDVWGKPVKLLDGLGVDFLHGTSKTRFTDHTNIGKSTNRWVKKHRADHNRLSQRVTHLHNVIVKQQPEAVTLHYGDVMTSIWATEETQTNSESLPCRQCSLPTLTLCYRAESATQIFTGIIAAFWKSFYHASLFCNATEYISAAASNHLSVTFNSLLHNLPTNWLCHHACFTGIQVILSSDATISYLWFLLT